jgi:fatty-acyl-CoA synthase
MLEGLMQDRPLLISSLIEHANAFHPGAEIVSRTSEGPIHRCTYGDIRRRSKQVAKALVARGVMPGDRVATLAWNGYRHMELYFGVSGMGGVLHTINPRLFPDQIGYIVNHAEDTLLFFDLAFVPLLEKLAPMLKSVKAFVAMTDRAHMPDAAIPNLLCYEDLVGAQDDDYEWPAFDERTASSLCYTSGTTGHPKGVLFSHRSTVLHTFAVCAVDGLGFSAAESALLVVPMFHVNAWGTAYAGAMSGAKLVMPGPGLDGRSVYELMRDEEVTLALGVPTVWLNLFNHVDAAGLDPKKDLCLRRIVIGGSAAPRAMSERFETQFGTFVVHAWGMTEMSPLGTVCNLLPKHRGASSAQRLDVQGKQGRPLYGVELRITDDAGRPLPHDGKAFGHLMVRGPWITRGYFGGEGGKILDADGFFDTGDVATIDPDGYMQITDRSKDVIKSGGEWISSIDLENVAMGHPAVAEAAVIGVPHPKWQERPLLVVVTKRGSDVSRDELLGFLADKVAKWCVPDDAVFVDELPHTATGKLQKMKLREMFRDYVLPTD